MKHENSEITPKNTAPDSASNSSEGMEFKAEILPSCFLLKAGFFSVFVFESSLVLFPWFRCVFFESVFSVEFLAELFLSFLFFVVPLKPLPSEPVWS